MSEEAIELLWAGFEPVSRFELHRLDRAAVPTPDSPELSADTLVYEGSETAFVDEAVTSGARYYYFLLPQGVDTSTPLRWTLADAVTDTEPPPPLSGLTVARSGDTVTLSWDQSSDNYEFARYAIRRSVDDGDSEYYGTGFSIDQITFVDDLLPPSGVLTYEVRAVDFHGNASEPATASVTL